MFDIGDSLGDWVVEGTLGEGGMGSVLLCHSELSTDIRAAVKVLKSNGLGDFKKRFVAEMRTLASLSHPSIVGVLSGGQDIERDLVYMAMELIDGGDLEHRLHGGAFTETEIRHTFLPLVSALSYAHQNGVHHRDIKPANIMLRTEGPPVLVDFGVALAKEHTRLTMDGMVPGTAAYMPPEVFRGHTPDPALGDIYALGVVLWEAMTGDHAFSVEGEMSDGQRLFQVVGLKVQSDALDPGAHVNPTWRELVKQMTAPDPSDRLTDLEQVSAALAGERTPAPQTQWVANPIMPRPTPQPTATDAAVETVEPRLPPPSNRRSRFARFGGAALVAAALVTTGVFGMASWSVGEGVVAELRPVAQVTLEAQGMYQTTEEALTEAKVESDTRDAARKPVRTERKVSPDRPRPTGRRAVPRTIVQSTVSVDTAADPIAEVPAAPAAPVQVAPEPGIDKSLAGAPLPAPSVEHSNESFGLDKVEEPSEPSRRRARSKRSTRTADPYSGGSYGGGY